MEKYLSGELSGLDQNAVERLMLDSDFESEAMEGFEQIGVEELKDDLAALNQNLEQKITEEKKIFPFWFKTAAAVAILALCSVLLLQIDYGVQKEAISESQKQEIPKASPDVESTTQTAKVITDTLLSMNQEPKLEEADEKESAVEALKDGKVLYLNKNEENFELLAFSESEDSYEEVNEISVPVPEPITSLPNEGLPEPEESLQVEKKISGRVEGLKMERTNNNFEKSPDDSKLRTFRKKESNAPSIKTVKGKVVAEDGAAVAGARVALRGSDRATTTDDEGNYSISVPAREDNTLVYDHEDLTSTEVQVNNLDQVDVKMSEFESEEEVASDKEEFFDVDTSATRSAYPIIGKSEFEKYLTRKVSEYESIKGLVILKVYVSPEGKLTKIEIEKGLGQPYDSAAIQYLKEGPFWSPALKDHQPVVDTVKVPVWFNH